MCVWGVGRCLYHKKYTIPPKPFRAVLNRAVLNRAGEINLISKKYLSWAGGGRRRCQRIALATGGGVPVCSPTLLYTATGGWWVGVTVGLHTGFEATSSVAASVCVCGGGARSIDGPAGAHSAPALLKSQKSRRGSVNGRQAGLCRERRDLFMEISRLIALLDQHDAGRALGLTSGPKVLPGCNTRITMAAV